MNGKRSGTLIVLITLFCMSWAMLFMYIGNVEKVFGAPSDDYKTWLQSDKRWASKPIGGGYSMRFSGCFVTSISMMVAYANPAKQDVNKFNPGVAAGYREFVNGGVTGQGLNLLDKTMHYYKMKWEFDGRDRKAVRQRILNAYNKGYFVIIQSKTQPITATNSHFSPIVGVKDGVPVVWDVAHGDKKGHRYEDWENTGGGICRLTLMYSDLCKSYEVMNGDTKSSTSAHQEVDKRVIKNQSVPKEQDLVGMPEEPKLTADMDGSELPDVSELQTVDTANIAAIKQGIEQGKKSPADYANTAISFIGILCMFYSLLMLLAYFFDYANVFVEVSLLGIITFGKMRILEDEDKENGIKGGYNEYDGYSYMTRGMIFTRIGITMVVGLLLVSGLLQRLLLSAIYFVADLVDKFINPV